MTAKKTESSNPKEQAENRADSSGATKEGKAPTDPTVSGGDTAEQNILDSLPEDHPVKVVRRTPANVVVRQPTDKPYLDDVNRDIEQQLSSDFKDVDEYNAEIGQAVV